MLDCPTIQAWLCYWLTPADRRNTPPGVGYLSTDDWAQIVHLAAISDLAALLYQRLKTSPPNQIMPAEVTEQLREMYLISAGGSMYRNYQLAQILTALQQAGVPVIVLKGGHLAEIVYDNTALRPMNDLDLLINKDDLLKAAGKLREMRYTSRPFHIGTICANYDSLPPFTKEKTLPIELHWTIESPTAPFTIDIKDLWRRAQPATIAGVDTLVLSPADLLLHQCLHVAFHHRFMVRLRAINDIVETIRHYGEDLDFEQIRLYAAQWGASKCVYLTLRLAEELLAATTPPEVMKALEPDNFEPKFIAWAREQIFAEPDYPPLLVYILARIWGALGFRDKVTTFLKFAFLPRTDMASIYSVSPYSIKIYLYYLLRLKKLLLRHSRAVWQLLRQDKADLIALSQQENKSNVFIDWLTSA